MLILKNNKAGIIKSVITIKLNAYKPRIFSIWIISVDDEKLYAQRFHGKPVSIVDLIKSEKAKPPDKSSIEVKFKFNNGPTIRMTIEKNKLKNNGININPKGINILKDSSNVNEFVIQWIPLR